MLLIGYFEGIDSERGIAWGCTDSLTLREFPGCGLKESTPDHCSLSRIRQRLAVETHEEVFTWVLKRLAETGLNLRGLSAHVLPGKFTLYLALHSAAEANKAVKAM